MKKGISLILAVVCLLLCCGCAAANPGTTGNVNAEVPGVTTQPIATTTQPVATTTIPVATTIPVPPTTQPTLPVYPVNVPYEIHPDSQLSIVLGGLSGVKFGATLFVVRSTADIENVLCCRPEAIEEKFSSSLIENNTVLVLAFSSSALCRQKFEVVGLEKVSADKYALTVNEYTSKWGDMALGHAIIYIMVHEKIPADATVELVHNEIIE